MHVAELLTHELGHPLLVLGMQEAPQQAHRGGLGLEVAQTLPELVLIEVAQHPVGAGPLRDRHAQLVRHERRRVAGAEPVELGARLATQLLQVGEALGGQQRRARHVPLK